MTTDPFSAFEFDADDAGRVLDEALVGADDGELFLETSTAESLAFDDGRLKVANFDAERGFGLRGVFGEASGFAHSSDPTLAALKRAGETANAARQGRDAVPGFLRVLQGLGCDLKLDHRRAGGQGRIGLRRQRPSGNRQGKTRQKGLEGAAQDHERIRLSPVISAGCSRPIS